MIRLKSAVLIGICVLAASADAAFGQTPTWTNQRSINQLTEHVYRFGTGMNHMFIVTTEGIIVGKGLVYREDESAADFWRLDLATRQSRRLTRLAASDRIRSFDITPDSRHIVFDRLRENSDIVLIDLPR